MSKYIKLEDAIHNINLEVTGRKEYTGDMKANLFFALEDLPTIEVSEEVTRPFEYFEGYEDGRKSVEVSEGFVKDTDVPISEDCIYTYCSRCGMRVVVDAPSVTAEQSCDTCKHNKLEWFSEECDGCTKANSNWERIAE